MNIRAKIYGQAADVETPILSVKQPQGVRADALHSIPVRRAEMRRSDTRLQDRYRIVEEPARITHNGTAHEVELINVCGSGAMISGDFAAVPWDRAALTVGDHGAIEAAILWIKDGRIGLAFAEETRLDCSEGEQAELLREVVQRHFPETCFDLPATQKDELTDEERADEKRDGRRHPLIWSGTLHYDHQSTPARLRNISGTGAMIETAAALVVGAEPLLDLDEAGSIFATVAWIIGDHAGLRFHEAFDVRQLAKSRPQVGAQGWEPPSYLRGDARYGSWDSPWNRMTPDEVNENLEGYLKH